MAHLVPLLLILALRCLVGDDERSRKSSVESGGVQEQREPLSLGRN
jgi:hypothetical protein